MRVEPRNQNFIAKKNKQSISFPQNVKIQCHQLKVPKVGLIEAKFTQVIEGIIKTVTISVTPSGKYYAAIGLDLGNSEVEQSTQRTCPHVGIITGIDLGLKDYVTCHNRTDTYSIKHPKWLKKHERNLRYQQKKLSRSKKGSNRRNKARLLVARVHERLSNARQDFLHKLSRTITDESQVVAVENLNIKGMVKNRKLSKAISQSGWGMFLNFLSYKLEQQGGVLVEVDRFFPSSKTCSNCGHIHEELELKDREWTCSQCFTHHLRDENASRNIRTEGMKIIGLGHSLRGDDVRLEARLLSNHL